MWKFLAVRKRRLNVQLMICTKIETNETFGPNLSCNSWITGNSYLKVQLKFIEFYINALDVQALSSFSNINIVQCWNTMRF